MQRTRTMQHRVSYIKISWTFGRWASLRRLRTIARRSHYVMVLLRHICRSLPLLLILAPVKSRKSQCIVLELAGLYQSTRHARNRNLVWYQGMTYLKKSCFPCVWVNLTLASNFYLRTNFRTHIAKRDFHLQAYHIKLLIDKDNISTTLPVSAHFKGTKSP